jgi:ribosomal protein S21
MVFVKGDIEKAIRAFRHEFQKSGIERELKSREYFIKPSERKRIEKRKRIRAAIDLQRKRENGLCR